MEFGISTFVTDEGMAPGALARSLEECGFDSLFVTEHAHISLSRKLPLPEGGELPREYCGTLDPCITLIATAAATEHLLVGTKLALVMDQTPIVAALRGCTIHAATERRDG